ncbi:MAG: 7-carboxy-7-deazaguanine synthase QueE [Bacteroidales bacterium]|jgi:organic radical activating enzyme|nr:7-carboxy-7-deazaguanine synthase QueE [Bacteroidales bacterium]
MNEGITYPSLEGGKKLPLVESFYTIQGEGFHSGKPAFFIRLGGCDVGCRWCDSKESWNPDRFPPVDIESIVRDAAATPAKAIVITGGEPMNYPLDPLCKMLKDYGLEIFLETSGSSPLSGKFDWICLSPKRNKPPREEFFPIADELKVIVETKDDFEWAEENRRKVLEVQAHSLFYLQPEWSRMKTVAPYIIEYVKEHPEWNISIQAHKFLRIP